MAAPMTEILTKLSRLSLCKAEVGRRTLFRQTNPNFFRVTEVLWGEPMKKKKRTDPAIVRKREEKRKKRLEREIRKLSKLAKKEKPLDEIVPPLELVREKKLRTRKNIPLSFEETERRALLHKEWSRFKLQQWLDESKKIEVMVSSQEEALEALKEENEELYQMAISIDPELIPFQRKGPVNTPPINNYACPDGEYKDISRKWE